MKEKDFEKLIGMMAEIIDMKHKLQKEKEDDDDEECPYCDESDDIEEILKKEYTEMMDWAFGKHFEGDTKERTIEIWKALHGDLPVPRILKSKCTNPLANTIGMVFDVLPMYLDYKKKAGK